MEIFVPKFAPIRRRLIQHPLLGRGQVVSPEGDILWEDPDWVPNALADEGEEAILNVFYRETSNLSKYLALIEGGTTPPAETSTMSYLGGGAGAKETRVPGVDGYTRPQIIAADWGAPALSSGDYQTAAAQKTFGPATSNNWTALTHIAIVSASSGQSSGSGKFLHYIALTGTIAVPVGMDFKYAVAVKAA